MLVWMAGLVGDRKGRSELTALGGGFDWRDLNLLECRFVGEYQSFWAR